MNTHVLHIKARMYKTQKKLDLRRYIEIAVAA